MKKLKSKLSELWRITAIKRTVIAILLLVCVTLLEMALSNARLAFIDEDKYITDYKAQNSEIELKYNKSTSYSFEAPKSEIYAVKITSEAQSHFASPVKVQIKAYDEKRSEALVTVATTYMAPGRDKLIYLDFTPSEGSLIKIELSDVKGSAKITDITVNPTTGTFRFNFLRAIIILLIAVAIWLCNIFNLGKEYFDVSKRKHRVVGAVTICACVIIVFIYCLAFVGAEHSYDYPLENGINTYDPYTQQFDAFLKGQLHIDYPVSEDILELENPYDHSAREGYEYLWDRAMYDGKYYSYFGIAPIINTYIPHYLFTGNIISDNAVVIVYALIATLFVCATVYAFIVIYKKRVPVSLISLLTLTAVVSSGIPLMARSTAHFYYIPVLCAMAYLSQFIFFIMLAVNSRHRVARPVLFALAGLNYAMLFLSRVNIALLTAFIVLPILYFAIIKGRPTLDKSDGTQIYRTVKERALDLTALGAFVVIAIIFTLIYNYVRFDNPLEFGTSYQLTVSDISKNEIDFSSFTAMLYHSFIQPFKTSGSFPFFSLQYQSLNDYGGYLYVDSGMGLFAIPFMLSLVFAVSVLTSKKKTAFAKALCIALFLGIIAVSVMNFYIGGVIYRYTSDLTLLCAIAGAFLIISFNETVYDSEGARTILIIEKAFLIVSIFVCAVVLTSLHGYLGNTNARVFVTIEEMFK